MSLQPVLCLAVVAAVLSAPSDKPCTEYEKACKNNGECCGGCCQENKCVPYSDSCVTANNPCYLHDCPPNKVCYLLQVQCLQSPCQPIPACKVDDSDYN